MGRKFTLGRFKKNKKKKSEETKEEKPTDSCRFLKK